MAPPHSRRPSGAGGPPPRGLPRGADAKGPLRKVDSALEAKGQRRATAGYGPLVGPGDGGIQRVSLSAMLAANPNAKLPKVARPPTLAAKAAPPREAPAAAAGTRVHHHAVAAEDALPSEWTQHWDEEVGSHYYFNSTTGEATWVQPT